MRQRIGAEVASPRNSDSIPAAHGDALRKVVGRAGARCRRAASFRYFLASVHGAGQIRAHCDRVSL